MGIILNGNIFNNCQLCAKLWVNGGFIRMNGGFIRMNGGLIHQGLKFSITTNYLYL